VKKKNREKIGRKINCAKTLSIGRYKYGKRQRKFTCHKLHARKRRDRKEKKLKNISFPS